MTRIGTTTVSILAILLAAPLPAVATADEPDAIDILEKADAATKAVKVVSYDAEYYGVGSQEGRFPKIKASVKAKPGKRSLFGTLFGGSGGMDRIYAAGVLTRPGSSEETRFKIATDGRKAYSIDETKKTYAKETARKATNIVALASRVFMREFLHPTPFSDELNAKTQRYEGSKKIAGVDCHVIYIEYQNDSKARWFFGKEDHLPRRVDRIFKPATEDEPEAAYTLVVGGLDTKTVLENELFVLKRPDGYERKKIEQEAESHEEPKLLAVGTKAPNWKLKSASGKTVELADLKGKVVVMDFWATWCGPCKRAMPGVQKLHEKFKDRPVAVFGVNCWERGDAAAYMKDKGYTYNLLVKADDVADTYRVSGIPTFYVIGPDGKIAYAASGFGPSSEKEIAKVISKQLKTSL